MLTDEQEKEAVEFWTNLKMYLNDAGYASFVDSGECGMILWEMGESGWNAYAVTDSGREAQLYEGTENKVPDFDEILDVRGRGGEDDDEDEDEDDRPFYYEVLQGFRTNRELWANEEECHAVLDDLEWQDAAREQEAQ